MIDTARILYPFGRRGKRPGDRFANYYERVLSSAIDLAFLFFILFDAFSWLSERIYGKNSPERLLDNGMNITWSQMVDLYLSPSVLPLVILNFGAQILILGLILILCEYKFHTTPGRFLVGLRLVDAKTEQNPSLFQLIRRFIGYFISLPPFMIGYIWCSWDKRGQAWHDKIAGTVILNERPPGWYWNQVKRLYRKLRGIPEKVTLDPPANDND